MMAISTTLSSRYSFFRLATLRDFANHSRRGLRDGAIYVPIAAKTAPFAKYLVFGHLQIALGRIGKTIKSDVS
jgi:hypothetical protein